MITSPPPSPPVPPCSDSWPPISTPSAAALRSTALPPIFPLSHFPSFARISRNAAFPVTLLSFPCRPCSKNPLRSSAFPPILTLERLSNRLSYTISSFQFLLRGRTSNRSPREPQPFRTNSYPVFRDNRNRLERIFRGACATRRKTMSRQRRMTLFEREREREINVHLPPSSPFPIHFAFFRFPCAATEFADGIAAVAHTCVSRKKRSSSS